VVERGEDREERERDGRRRERRNIQTRRGI
jgi:hypothetical protein